MINNIDDDGQLAGIGTVVDEDNTANFNLTLESTLLEGVLVCCVS